MNCMKCGSEIEYGQVFCTECLLEMEKYPVKPGTAIQLPRQQKAALPKKASSRRRTVSAEDQVKLLKKHVRLLSLLLLCAVLLLALLARPAIAHLMEDHRFQKGQNYSSATTEPDVSRETQKIEGEKNG